MNHYKHITLEGVQYIQAVNNYPETVFSYDETGTACSVTNYLWQDFAAANPPIIWYGEAFEGTISEDEIEFVYWLYNYWKPFPIKLLKDYEGAKIAARLKAEKVEQPNKNLAEKLRELKDGETLDLKTWEVEQPVQQEQQLIDKFDKWHSEAVEVSKLNNQQPVQPSTPIVEEETLPVVILKGGWIYDNRLFNSLSQARNYVAMRNPKRKWKKSDKEDEMVCAHYGTKFIFQPLDIHQ